MMSEHQPPRTIPEEKVFPDVNGIYSELVQPIKADSGEDPTSSIYVNSDSIRKKQSPPSFKPPPPPGTRPVTIRQKSTTKQKEVSQLNISENHECKKRPKGCNFEEKNAGLTRQDDKHVNEDAIIKTKETSWFGDNPDSTTLLPNPNIRHDFERISQMPDTVKEAYMTERFTKCKRDKSIGTIKEETMIIDNSNIEVASVNRETTTANNIDKSMESAGKGVDIKCNVHFKLDSDEIEKESDEEGYVLMGFVGTKTATAHVISPAVRRQATPKPFGSLSKSQLVRCLQEYGLKDLAAVCQNEKLDGQFLEKHVSDEDLMQDPFLLTRFQIRKLRAIIDGWRPISDLKNDVDTGSG